MRHQNNISRGIAYFDADGLRCGATRKDNPNFQCRKLLAKLNADGQIAGDFKCERCRQVIEVRSS